MAALSLRAVKLAAIGGAAVPVIGLSGRLSAASKDDEEPKYIRACDIPLYPTVKVTETAGKQEKEDPNTVQIEVTKFRKWSAEVFRQIRDGYDTVKDKAQIGAEHSKATLDYVQNNPGELPRVAFISVATMGGFIIGYRKSIVRKLLYATIAGLSSAALCYPHFTLDLTNALKEDAKLLWKENIGWPFSETKEKELRSKSVVRKVSWNFDQPRSFQEVSGYPTGEQSKAIIEEEESRPVELTEITGDPGQSKPEDNDLYSTRS